MKLFIAIFAASMTIVSMPLAAADETDPDCEANQPLIGYASTQFIRNILEDRGYPGGLYVCEGEHWDGQDTVQADQPNPGCNPALSPNANDLFVGYCMGTDPKASGDVLDPLNPLGFRVSALNQNGQREAYIGINIDAVGQAVVYTSRDSSAVYLRDNTPGNVLATVVSAARITQGYPSENDCSQSTYAYGAANPPSQCGRDNTAITVYYATLP